MKEKNFRFMLDVPIKYFILFLTSMKVIFFSKLIVIYRSLDRRFNDGRMPSLILRISALTLIY